MPDAFARIDFEDFHRNELPRRIAAGNGALATTGVQDAGPLAFEIRESGRSFTYVPTPASIEIQPGSSCARTVVSVAQRSWEGLVHDLESPPSLLYHGEAEGLRGNLMHFVQWEASLRALYTGRPLYDPEQLDLRGLDGEPLDPAHAFRIDDDPEEMAQFLREVGYLFVKELFSDTEVEQFRAAAELLRQQAVPGDQKSWWGRNERGEEVLCRVIEAGSQPALGPLPQDPRIGKLVALSDTPMVPKPIGDRDSVTVLWKNPGMVEGLSDLPWHRDCGMGGHASMCPTLVGSIFLQSNDEATGPLRFLPGSWKKSYRFADAGDESALEGVLIPAGPGDFTLHYGDGWHTAPPPAPGGSGPYRSCVLVSFEREGAFNHRGERHYNDVLLGSEDGQVEHLTRLAENT